MLKKPADIKEILLGQNARLFFPRFSCFTARCLLVIVWELWWVNQKWLELRRALSVLPFKF
jgi:hypothetical protein